MLKHHLTKYGANGKRFAESWLQFNLFGKKYALAKEELNFNDRRM